MVSKAIPTTTEMGPNLNSQNTSHISPSRASYGAPIAGEYVNERVTSRYRGIVTLWFYSELKAEP